MYLITKDLPNLGNSFKIQLHYFTIKIQSFWYLFPNLLKLLNVSNFGK